MDAAFKKLRKRYKKKLGLHGKRKKKWRELKNALGKVTGYGGREKV